MGSLGFGEILLIGVVALIAFGGERLPQAARRTGRVLRQFRDVVDSARREITEAVDKPPPPELPKAPPPG